MFQLAVRSRQLPERPVFPERLEENGPRHPAGPSRCGSSWLALASASKIGATLPSPEFAAVIFLRCRLRVAVTILVS